MTENSTRGKTEILSTDAYASQYAFLKGLPSDIETTHFENDAKGQPRRHIRFTALTHGTDGYEIEKIQDIREATTPVLRYLLLIWEIIEDDIPVVWFQSHGLHYLKEGSVVQLSEMLPELEGFHIVDRIAMETDDSEGATLFCVLDITSKLKAIVRQTNGILWQYSEGMEYAKCLHEFEVDDAQPATVKVTRTSRHSLPSPPEDASPIEEKLPGSNVISPSILQMLTAAQSKPSPQKAAHLTESDSVLALAPATPEPETASFAGFCTAKTSDLDQDVIGALLRGQTPAISQSLGEYSDTASDDFSFCRQIISDNESDDEAASSGEIPESVPFFDADFGLTQMNCTTPVLDNIVLHFKCSINQKLNDAAHILRLILVNDRDGLRFSQILSNAISKSIDSALMQKGDSAVLIPQMLYGGVHRGMQRLDVCYQYHGGILLHVLDGIERIYREEQFSLVRLRIEACPANPFEHMLNSAKPRISYPLTVVDQTDALTPSKMPHLKQLIEQPEISTLTDQQMKSLFKNAPYLMKNEISKPKFLNKMKDYVGQRASGPLRRYQAECIERFLTGENFIFVAPTGAGKTKIFVECSRRLLVRNKSATIVVTCPSVALATQQACVYVVEGFLTEGYWVNTFSSDNQLTPQAWRHLASCHNVMVLTPQLLLNVMDFYRDVDYSIFNEIDLLILDECHHVRKEHAYNKIMTAHKNTKNCKTQVLGFTASPARSPDVEEGEQNLDLLLNQMQARCIVLTETNSEVQEHVPSAKEETAYAEEREEDVYFARYMGRFMYSACYRYINPLVGRVAGVLRLPDQSLSDMGLGLMSSTFENWAKLTVEKLLQREEMSWMERTDIVSSVELLRACNNSLDLVNDAGFESSLKVLAQRILEISSVFSKEADVSTCIYPSLLAGVYCTRMIQSITPVLQAFNMSPYPSGHSRFPRFVKLVQFLERYKEQDELHGMVFVKTRDGVYHLAKMLRMMPSMKNTFIFEFTGHGQGNKKKTQMPLASTSETLRGMSGSKQQEVLDQFCRPGRHILCATSAAEEGINVTSCQFVVRYSVTYTGIQRVQSRGRSRVRGGIFFNIIQRDSKESKFLEKSQQEEVNMNTVLRNSDRVEHL